ncbi:MAG TPA: LysM domain-containing protein [Anaeromyxobacteraceae bacterium]|nr:LysM domain-containing protein [Anaeromyxobacteraceae bacterium]
MTRILTLAAALLPLAALAQPAAIEAARGARQQSNEANARIQERAEAAAQEAAPAGEAEGEAAPGEEVVEFGDNIELTPQEGGAAAEGGAATPPDTYTVRPGDTLWDLSGRFLNNPWYWPKVWSYNPEITNPNWIYPGNLIRFYPAAEEAPARVEPVEVAEAPRELEDLSRAEMQAQASLEEAETVAVSGPYKIGYVPPKAMQARNVTFVTRHELEQSGRIKGAFEEKLMLSTLDKTYAEFERSVPVKVGETYLVYKTERAIHHPRTGEMLGYQTTILGSARVTRIDDDVVSLVITSTNFPIERGALLGPWNERVVRSVKRRPNQVALQGHIVASQFEIVTEIGEHHVVFVDKGKKHGVEVGNVFTVVRSGDPYGKPPKKPMREAGWPKEDMGDLLVVDAQETVSTALVVKSRHELAIGDEVEMRPASGAGGG